jgi:hypothetical protein
MAANIRIYSIKGETYFLLEESVRNDVGTPIVSVAKATNNLARAGIYTLTFTAITPGVQATCVVAAIDPHDPSRNPGGVTVLLDGTTVHANVIEGLGLVFSSSGSFNSSWTGRIFYGAFYDSSDSSTNSITREGTIVAGSDSTPQRLAARNDGSERGGSSSTFT